MDAREFRALMTAWVKEARTLYGVAIAAEVIGLPSAGLWGAWSEPVAALLMGGWALGSFRVIRAAKMQEMAPMPEGGLPLSVTGYEAGSSAQVQAHWEGRIPVTRQQWEELRAWAQGKSLDMAAHESANAVPDIAKQSPDVEALFAGRAPKGHSRANAFFVTGLDAQQAAGVKAQIADVLSGRQTITTARGNLREMGLGEFIGRAQLTTARDLTAARLETVLRTNMSSAQSQGEAVTLRNPVVRNFVPLLQWSAVRDTRTRPTHAAMSGYIGTIDDFDRQHMGPPASFNCRCSRIPMPVSVAMDRGFVNPDGTINREAIDAHNGARQGLIDSGAFPDPGFVG